MKLHPLRAAAAVAIGANMSASANSFILLNIPPQP